MREAGAMSRVQGDRSRAITHLAARYDEPWRAYHTRIHVQEMLTALEELTPGPLHPALELAAWAHDVVYDPHAPGGANERASADRARRILTDAGIDAPTINEVVDLTLATITHESSIGDDTGSGRAGDSTEADSAEQERRDRMAAFLDADLWILSAPRERFAEYEEQIRAEFAFVPEDLFQRGRAAILDDFARRERLYVTEHAYRCWEPAARRNLERIGHHG